MLRLLVLRQLPILLQWIIAYLKRCPWPPIDLVTESATVGNFGASGVALSSRLYTLLYAIRPSVTGAPSQRHGTVLDADWDVVRS